MLSKERRTETASRPANRNPALGPRRRSGDSITEGLRRMFDEVASEPVPDEFLELLRSIDDARGPDGAR